MKTPGMKPFLLLFIIVLAASCASVKILKEETAPGVDLSSYNSFSFYAVTAAGDTTPRKADQRMGQLRQAIRKELELKGYRFNPNSPDFQVNAYMRVKQDVQTRE